MAELQNGMKFDSYKSLCDFTGIKFDKHKSFLISRIHKICNTHIEDNKIIVDKVFGLKKEWDVLFVEKQSV